MGSLMDVYAERGDWKIGYEEKGLFQTTYNIQSRDARSTGKDGLPWGEDSVTIVSLIVLSVVDVLLLALSLYMCYRLYAHRQMVVLGFEMENRFKGKKLFHIVCQVSYIRRVSG